MKYILVVGLEYKKYKKSGTVRISAGDRLIDEFRLDVDLPATTGILPHIMQKHYETHGHENLLTDEESLKEMWTRELPCFYKVYKIDEKYLEQTLDIKVLNADSDFNNGFMKNSSLIKFSTISMFPASLVQDDCNKFLKMVLMINRAIHRYKIRNKVTVIPSELRGSWPVLTELEVKFKNKQHNIQDGLYRCSHWLGGDFTIRSQIKKKHGFRYLHSPGTTSHGFFKSPGPKVHVVSSLKQLINSYNED